jgi:hypothetical protein
MRKTAIALLTAVSLVLAVGVATAANNTPDKKPDGIIELKSKSVGAGLGVTWGDGILKFKGKNYPISIRGLDLGDIGVANVTATGKVYDLKKLDDFNGNYASVGAGAALGGGADAIAMKNQHGVRVDLVSTTQGVKVALATGGVTMNVKK